MHREIEKFISAAITQMKTKHWDKSDLIQHAGVGGTTINTVLRGDIVSQKSIRKIGQALGIQPSTINSAVGVSKPWRANLTVRKVEKPTNGISEVEQKLRSAWTHLELAVKDLRQVEELTEKVLDDVSERLRGFNGLKQTLEIFEKH